MPKIFISYRRDDTGYVATLLAQRLIDEFGRGSVFLDVDHIPPGVDFRKHIDDAVAECDVLLALVGDSWMTKGEDGKPRLEAPRDFLRTEIESALTRKISVIPVLTDKADMPSEESLPESISEFAYLNALELRAGADLPSHLGRLVSAIKTLPQSTAITTLPQSNKTVPHDAQDVKEDSRTTKGDSYKAQERDECAACIVPTLLIGLGGTGKDILQRYRKTVWEKFGDPTTPFAQTLVIDTDMCGWDIPSEEKPEDYSHVRLRPERNECLDVMVANDQYWQAEADLTMRNDRRFTDWLHPKFFETVHPQALLNGCASYRQAGRLAFFIHYRAIRRMIEEKLQGIRAYQANVAAHDGNDVDSDRIEIVIVTSLAGGTGAGMFLDIAYLLKDILSTVPQFSRHGHFDPTGVIPHVTFIGLLPTPYTRKDAAMTDRFQLNGYASLLEIERYNTPPAPNDFDFDQDKTPIEFIVNWDDSTGHEKVIAGRPWDVCYLIDDTNDLARHAPRSLPDLCRMVARYLALDLERDEFAFCRRAKRAVLTPMQSNVEVVEIHDSTIGQGQTSNPAIIYRETRSCGYSSFGLSEISLDSQRMRKAASFRLASKLIQEKVIANENTYTSDNYSQWAKEDLFSDANSITKGMPSFDPSALTLELLSDKYIDWVQWVNNMCDELADLDPIAVPDIAERVEKFLSTFEKLITGETVDGVDGTIKETLENQSRFLLGSTETGPLKNRLDVCSRSRVDKIGIKPVLKLLESYEEELSEARHKIRHWKKIETPNREEILARLIDAFSVPFVRKKRAIRIEYPRTIDNLRHKFLGHLRCIAASYADGIYTDGISFVSFGQSSRDESLVDRYRASMDCLIGHYGLCEVLDFRFEVFRRQPNSNQQISLMPDWRGEEYDIETNSQLMQNSRIGPDPLKTETPDLARTMSVLWNTLELTNTSDYLSTITRINGSDRERAAEDFASATRLLLSGNYATHHFADGDVGAYLTSQTSNYRHRLLQMMVDSSAPLFPSAPRSDTPQPYWSNLLGVSENSNETRVQDEICALSKANSNDISRDSIGPVVNVGSSRIALLREMRAAPLFRWARLPALQDSYFNSDAEFRQTCHIRFREQAADLPEITPLDDQQYEQISQNAHVALNAILLNHISFSDERGFGIDVEGDSQIRSYNLGMRFERAIKNACLINRVSRSIELSWYQWRDAAAPLHIAVLYNTIQQNLQATVKNSTSSPFENCLRKLLVEVERDLKTTADGSRFFDLLRHRDTLDTDFDEWQTRFTALTQHVRETCLVTPCESMPLLQIDQSKIKNVNWLE